MFNPLPWAGPGRSLARKMLLLSPVFSFPCQSLPAPSRLCECDHSLASATAHALTPPWCHWSPPSTMIAWVTIGCSQHKFRRIYICFPIISLGPGKWCYQKHGFYDKTDNTEKSFWNVFYFYVFFLLFTSIVSLTPATILIQSHVTEDEIESECIYKAIQVVSTVAWRQKLGLYNPRPQT